MSKDTRNYYERELDFHFTPVTMGEILKGGK